MLLKKNQKSLLDAHGKHPVEGYVVYTQADGWVGRLFRHHVALIVRNGDYWVYMDPAIGFTELQAFLVGTKWRDQFKDAKLQKFRIWRETKKRRGWYPAFGTCVEHCKAVLGISSPFILTPRQLHRRIESVKDV